jgi:hypothetical protein
MSFSPDYVAWAGIGAIASALTSVIAAIAAWRSAESARAAIDQAALERRAALMREASMVTNRVLALAAHVVDLADKADLAYTSLFALAGHDVTKSPRLDIYKRRNEQKRARAGSVLAEVRDSSEYAIDRRTDNELAEVIRTMDGHLARLEKIEAHLLLDLDQVESQNRVFQENQIQKGFGVAPR